MMHAKCAKTPSRALGVCLLPRHARTHARTHARINDALLSNSGETFLNVEFPPNVALGLDLTGKTEDRKWNKLVRQKVG